MRRLIKPECRSVRATTRICAGTLPAFSATRGLERNYDSEIPALVEIKEVSGLRAAAWIGEGLIERRDKIAEAWLTKVLPPDNFRISYGKLVFEDLATAPGIAKPRHYTVGRASCNANGRVEALPYASARVSAFRMVPSAASDAIGTKKPRCADLRGRLRQLMTAPAGLIRHAPSCTVGNRLIHNAA